MQSNSYEKRDKTLFDELQGCFDKDLFLAGKAKKKPEENASDRYLLKWF